MKIMKKLIFLSFFFSYSVIADVPKIEINENPANGVQYRNNGLSSSPSLNDLMNQKNIRDENDKENNFRLKIISESAYTIGYRAGIVNKSNELISILNSRADKLDLIFNFSTLISKNGVLPPVIVESEKVAAFSRDQIRTANKVYKIKKEERFVSNPPTWADYLFLGLQTKFTDEYVGIKPKSSEEIKTWKESVKSGWIDGRSFAVDVLEANFNRLITDFTGMMRYSELLQQRMITKSKTARSISTITGNEKQIILGDELQRLIEKASFELNVDKWRASSRMKANDKKK